MTGYTSIFANFTCMIGLIAVRMLTYMLHKFQSVEAINGLQSVSPKAFYVLFLTEIGISLLVLVLVFKSTEPFVENSNDF